jgi:predicted Rossmann fold flavoprotein
MSDLTDLNIISNFEVIIIGASASGLMSAIEAGKRGRKVLVLDHTNKIGKKILMSGGGRCNFTNYYVSHENYISNNPHFCKSALSRYTPYDFLDLIHKHEIPYHEKKLGQLFCDNKSIDIVNMLLDECEKNKVKINLNTKINDIKKLESGFLVKTSEVKSSNLKTSFKCESLVIATGGLSIPTMGATAFGYNIAKKFGIKVWPQRAGLVPFTLHQEDKEKYAPLSGVSVNSSVKSICGQGFSENILLTHRGLSGPAILQISSYWNLKEEVEIDLLPDISFLDSLREYQMQNESSNLKTFLSNYFPKRLLPVLIDQKLLDTKIKSLNHPDLKDIENKLHKWKIAPNGTEGYRTAEVTLGGVDCNAISSKTMEARKVKGLFFVGEVLDVTGWLGGYNFQWAWASGWCAGQVV